MFYNCFKTKKQKSIKDRFGIDTEIRLKMNKIFIVVRSNKNENSFVDTTFVSFVFARKVFVYV